MACTGDDHQAVAVFITPHGYGHAARTVAVMTALHQHLPTVHFHIYTKVPNWFFKESLDGCFTYHSLLTDIGVIQDSPMQEDLPATVAALEDFLPFQSEKIGRLADELTDLGCSLALCDISPLGIETARLAGIPSILEENFTWDWIYAGYLPKEPRLAEFLPYLRSIFESADYHIQTSPACLPTPTANRVIPPVGRSPKQSRAAMRDNLRVGEHEPLVLVTMGGIKETFSGLEALEDTVGDDIRLVIPGGSRTVERKGRLILLPHHSDFYHPDLVHASDAVVGKVGYSTLAEVYWAGIPFGYIPRPDFRETPYLVNFIQSEMRGFEIPPEEFESGAWVARVPQLLSLDHIQRQGKNGASLAAEFIMNILEDVLL
jgi:UDP:flavonoid glycosyltransferase YjiC (YdhE family)